MTEHEQGEHRSILKTWSNQMDDSLSDDKLLGGRLEIIQPAQGHRVGIDAVLLAAAVPAIAGQLALEGGSGVGAASLCLGKRVAGVRIDAIEINPELAELARQNMIRNGFQDNIEIYCGDITAPPYRITANTYHQVFMNPPFLEQRSATASPNSARAQAHQETSANLRDWIKFAVTMARPGGCITLIHRADRLDDVLAALKGRAGGCEVFPLWPGMGKAAKRVIVRAYKANDAPLRLLPGLVLHDGTAKYSAAAEAVLRHAKPLEFSHQD